MQLYISFFCSSVVVCYDDFDDDKHIVTFVIPCYHCLCHDCAGALVCLRILFHLYSKMIDVLHVVSKGKQHNE